MGRKRERTSRKKLNDRGMTLVEVLVAMMMLSVVSLVFLRSFSQTMHYNKNAREKQYALTVAQSMMEGMKAYGMNDLDEQFSGAAPFRLYPPAASSVKSGSCAAGGYQIKEIQSGDFTFDVNVEVSPAAADASKPNEVTAAALVSGSDVNKYKDAFYVQGQGVDVVSGLPESGQDIVRDKVVNALRAVPDMHYEEKAGLTKETVKWSYVTLQILRRTLQVEIGPSTVTVRNVYQYSFDITDYPYRTTADPPGSSSGVCGTNGSGFAEDALVECYNNAATADQGAQLENLYLYFYPAYNSTQGGYVKCLSDSIEIRNLSSRVINVHAVKQKNYVLSNPEMMICEGSYSVTVNQSGTEKVVLYHNLKERLAGSGSGSYTCTSAISGKPIEDKQALWERDAAPRTLVYNVKATVLESGTGKVIYELSGTVNEK